MWVDQVVESGLISLLSVVFCGCFSYGFEWVLVRPWVFSSGCSGFCLWRWWVVLWVLFLVVGVDFFSQLWRWVLWVLFCYGVVGYIWIGGNSNGLFFGDLVLCS